MLSCRWKSPVRAETWGRERKYRNIYYLVTHVADVLGNCDIWLTRLTVFDPIDKKLLLQSAHTYKNNKRNWIWKWRQRSGISKSCSWDSGRKVPAARISRKVKLYEMKLGGLVHSHKLINLMQFNWHLTPLLHRNDATTANILAQFTKCYWSETEKFIFVSYLETRQRNILNRSTVNLI